MSSSDPDLPNVVADFANPRAIDIQAESENLKLRGGLYGEKVYRRGRTQYQRAPHMKENMPPQALEADG